MAHRDSNVLPVNDVLGKMARVCSPAVKKAVQQEGFGRRKRGYRDINEIDINMNDPLFTKQWYLINTGQADGTPGLDLNVAEAWELGYTGKGVTIGIMDDETTLGGGGMMLLAYPECHLLAEAKANQAAPGLHFVWA
ncbi:UNVERIFIED_CONTAM: hypothetical protein K2H54_045941 [Gekko kuhli]